MKGEYFYLDDWSMEREFEAADIEPQKRCFDDLCTEIYNDIMSEWTHEDSMEKATEAARLQKGAIIGIPQAVAVFKNKIEDYLRLKNKSQAWHPPWYENIKDAVFHEKWGLAGLAEFFGPKYADSSSAKVIGEDVFFLTNGRQQLMPQKISDVRRRQLARAFCMDDATIRLDDDTHEVYMHDGSRVTIYNESMTMRGQDVIIIRRYILPKYTLDIQAQKGTINTDMIPFFKSMIKLGYNIIFSGAVRTAKTTFLQTFLTYEDSTLEGMLIQTDPEIDIKLILPHAPAISLVVKDKKMEVVVPSMLRSDMDWLAFAEARDGLSLDTAVTAASKGTRRVKLTFHSRAADDICYDMAAEIVKYTKGDLENTKIKVAKTFDYVFHFVQLKDKSQKRLSSITELTYCKETHEIITTELCRYDFISDKWCWHNHISDDKAKAGRREDDTAFKEYAKQLEALASKYPNKYPKGGDDL